MPNNSFFKLPVVRSSLFFLVSFLGGVLGALSVYIALQLWQPQMRMGTINLTGIVDHFVQSEARKKIPTEILRREVKAFGQELEKRLQRLAATNQLMLFTAEAVVAGGVDYTSRLGFPVDNKHD